jgi:hypothetical protein
VGASPAASGNAHNKLTKIAVVKSLIANYLHAKELSLSASLGERNNNAAEPAPGFYFPPLFIRYTLSPPVAMAHRKAGSWPEVKR